MQLDRHLLDRKILDRDGRIVGNVDDIAFGVDDDGLPYVRALLVGQLALGQRIGGWLGRWLSHLARRLSAERPARPIEISYQFVAEVDSAVHLSVGQDRLPEPALESWLRRNVIDRIPGSGHAGG